MNIYVSNQIFVCAINNDGRVCGCVPSYLALPKKPGKMLRKVKFKSRIKDGAICFIFNLDFAELKFLKFALIDRAVVAEWLNVSINH